MVHVSYCAHGLAHVANTRRARAGVPDAIARDIPYEEGCDGYDSVQSGRCADNSGCRRVRARAYGCVGRARRARVRAIARVPRGAGDAHGCGGILCAGRRGFAVRDGVGAHLDAWNVE